MKISELFKVEGLGVIVTGGASGLGLGFVEALAGNGARAAEAHLDRLADGAQIGSGYAEHLMA